LGFQKSLKEDKHKIFDQEIEDIKNLKTTTTMLTNTAHNILSGLHTKIIYNSTYLAAYCKCFNNCLSNENKKH
jgi:hypothetical protein